MKSCVFRGFFFNLSTLLTRDYKTFLIVLQHGTTLRLRGRRPAYPSGLLCSLVVSSRSTLGPVQIHSLFHRLHAQHSTDSAWLRLFHGLSLDRHPSVSRFVLRNFLVVMYQSCHFIYSFMNRHMCMRRHYRTISIVIM